VGAQQSRRRRHLTTDGGDTGDSASPTERIARIAIDPSASETVYVVVTGHLWNRH
jgi:hypothetical protein